MEKRSTPIYNVLKFWVLQCIYWIRFFPDIDNHSDGGIETIDSNIFKSSQLKSDFQIQPIKCPVQNNEISTAYWPLWLHVPCRLSVNCQAQTFSTFVGLNWNICYMYTYYGVATYM